MGKIDLTGLEKVKCDRLDGTDAYDAIFKGFDLSKVNPKKMAQDILSIQRMGKEIIRTLEDKGYGDDKKD